MDIFDKKKRINLEGTCVDIVSVIMNCQVPEKKREREVDMVKIVLRREGGVCSFLW